MRNPLQKQRNFARDTAIYTQFRVMSKKNLRYDYIIDQLSQQYFLSKRKIAEIVRQKAQAVDATVTA